MKLLVKIYIIVISKRNSWKFQATLNFVVGLNRFNRIFILHYMKMNCHEDAILWIVLKKKLHSENARNKTRIEDVEIICTLGDYIVRGFKHLAILNDI